MLTKEECLNALDELSIQTDKEIVYQDEINGYVSILQQLINEHFNFKPFTLRLNPPLKFEDLYEGMWIWDNQTKRYMKIYDISYSEESFNVNGEWCLNDLYLEEFKFEKNRFYRREVKKNEK